MSKKLKEKVIKLLKNQTCRSCGYKSDNICLKGTKGFTIKNLDNFCYYWKNKNIVQGMSVEEILAREG